MSKEIVTKTLLDVHQAAKVLGVNPGTIRRWAQEGTLRGVKVGVRGDWRFTEESLGELAKDNIEPAALQSPKEDLNHQVQFYEDEAYLLSSLKDYIASGLMDNEVCIVIATDDHLRSVRALLKGSGINLENAVTTGRLVLHDAESTLAKFMVNGLPDADKFHKVIGSVMAEAQTKSKNIRAYGEMVAVLWGEGNLAGLIRLEELWNDLADSYDFSLLCGYSLTTFRHEGNSDAFAEINQRHTHVIPAESYTPSKDPIETSRAVAAMQQKAEELQHEIRMRRKALQELETQAASMQAEQMRLQDLNNAKDEFISIASHQLRTPATGVKQYIGMLLEGYFGPLTKEQIKYLSKAYDSNERQITTVNNLLLIAKVDAGNIHITPKAHDVVQLILDVVDEQRAEFTRRRHIVSMNMPQALTARLDPQYMRMVIENLLSNASKYSPDGTAIEVAAKTTASHVVIRVRDRGIGISKQDQAKLYKKFSRIFNDQSTAEGNGLGLYWSKKIVELHHGELSLESEPGKGSTFTVKLLA